MSFFLVLEEHSGRISNASWEALAAALRLVPAENITAVVIGAQTEELAAEAATKPVGKVVRIEHPLLAHYTADGFCAALQQLIQKTLIVREPLAMPASRVGHARVLDILPIPVAE